MNTYTLGHNEINYIFVNDGSAGVGSGRGGDDAKEAAWCSGKGARFVIRRSQVKILLPDAGWIDTNT